jgi:two-component system cell cycle response regulator
VQILPVGREPSDLAGQWAACANVRFAMVRFMQLRRKVSAGLKILVVDDDEAVVDVLAKAIVSFGHLCRTAADGLQAWQLHQAERADVIVSDWDMPGIDGIELCRRTRVAADEAYTYFILMTAFADKAHFVRGMQAGADDYQTKPIDLDELQARLVSAERVISVYRRLSNKNRSLRHDSQAAIRLARTDPLTGVANRLHLREALEALLARSQGDDLRCSIALCDIDHFKAYNDHFGHVAGDAVLRNVAQTIQGELRRGDALYRYGGEEFLIAFPEQSVSDASRAAERARRAVESLGIRTVGRRGIVTISIGVAQPTPDDASIDSWIERADAALYRAKHEGRNRVEREPHPGADGAALLHHAQAGRARAG